MRSSSRARAWSSLHGSGAGIERLGFDGGRIGLGTLGAAEQVGELFLLVVGETRQFEVESVPVGWVVRGGHGAIK